MLPLLCDDTLQNSSRVLCGKASRSLCCSTHLQAMGIDRCKERHVIGYRHLDMRFPTIIDIIANNPTNQKFVELSSSQHYSLVENSMYRSVVPPQGGEDSVFLPSSPRASEAFACHD